MSEATQPKSVGLPRLPSWDLTGTASQLYEQQASTKVILGTYQTFLSDLIGEFNEKNTRRKAERVEVAANDLRTAYSQYIAISSCFLSKTKDSEQRKEVKDARELAAAEHATFQKKANEVAETMEAAGGLPASEEAGRGRHPITGRRLEENKPQLKPVKELEPSITAHFKLSGADLEKWVGEMAIWSQASGFENCAKPVQVAFAKKFVEDEMDEKIHTGAKSGGEVVTLFDSYSYDG